MLRKRIQDDDLIEDGEEPPPVASQIDAEEIPPAAAWLLATGLPVTRQIARVDCDPLL